MCGDYSVIIGYANYKGFAKILVNFNWGQKGKFRQGVKKLN